MWYNRESDHHRTRALIPTAPDRALECRLRDRFYDTYIHLSIQKIVGDRLRPEGKRDPLGVEQARAQMETAYAFADDQLRAGPWAMGDDFTLADCAALPALFYGDKVAPFAKRWSNITAYFERLKGRPSVERVLAEAAPYMKMFPGFGSSGRQGSILDASLPAGRPH